MRFTDFNIINESTEPDIIRALRDFLPVAVRELKLKRLPKIKFLSKLDNDEQPTFGSFSHDGANAMIQLNIMNRHPVDLLRTLAHELVHYKQFVHKQLGPNSGDTGSSSENEAHVVAGIIMRHFDKQYPEYLSSKNISNEQTAEEFNEGKVTPSSKDLKLAKALEDYANKNISEREPGFGDFMYHAELIRKGHKDVHKQDLNTVQKKYRTIMTDMIKQHLDETIVVSEGLTYMDPVAKWVAVFKASTHPKFKGKTAEQREKMARMAQYKAVQNKKPINPGVKENMDHSKAQQAVAELKAALISHKNKLQGKDDDAVYKIIDQLMTIVAKAHGLTGQKLHDMWVKKYKEIPDTWIMNEAIAPHGSPADEFKRMQAGNKPAALVDPVYFKKLYKKTADANHWPYFQFKVPGINYRNFVVGLPGQEKRIRRIAEIVTDMNVNMQQGIKPGKEYHTELGRLLGYADSDIQDFLKNVDLDEEYRDADYARGNVKMPTATLGRTKHPLHGKLVGGQ